MQNTKGKTMDEKTTDDKAGAAIARLDARNAERGRL